MRVGLVGLGCQADVLIRTRAVANPSLGTILQIEGGNATASSELIATEAHDHLILGDQRSGGDGLALLRVSILDDPSFLTGLAVKSNHETIESAINEFAIGIGAATVDGVAASARHSRLVTVGLLDVGPNLLRVVRIRKIKSLNHVTVGHGRATRHHEQHGLAANILDDQGLAFVATQSVRALVPNHLELVDVLVRDVRKRAVTRKLEVTTRGRPLVGVSHTLQLLRIGISHCLTGNTHRQRDD